MSKYQLGEWVVDSSRGILLGEESVVQMEPKCMDLLVLLINANGELVTRKAIMESLWNGRYVSDHALNNVVAMLRKHLNSGNNRSYIKTQPKRGYILSEPALEFGQGLPEKEDPRQNDSNSLNKSIVSVLLSLFVIATIITIVVFQPARVENESVALLPFESLDADDSSAMFAKGLSEEINHQLSSNTSLKVVIPSIASQADQDQLSNQAIAQQLKAEYFLEGTVRAGRNALRITTRLFHGETGVQLWSKVYTANKHDMLSSQNSIGRQITKTTVESIVSINMSRNLNHTVNSNQAHFSHENINTVSGANVKLTTSSATKYFLNLAKQVDSSQSITNEWQIGMYNGGVFELFDYSATTVLGRPAIVGWVNRGFHAGFLNTNNQDELFPGNTFKAGELNLHPGQNSGEIVLRYLVQRDGEYNVSGHFLAVDTIECFKCTSDGVNVSIKINGEQLNDSQDLLGFGATTTYKIVRSGISLKQGDIIDFIVMPRSTFFDDATKITANISWRHQL